MGNKMAHGAIHPRPMRPITRPAELARRMAHAAHALRAALGDAVEREPGSPTLSGLLDACRAELLRGRRDQGDTDIVGVADLVAQTATYALFVARCLHTGPRPFARANLERLPASHPLLCRILATLAGPALAGGPVPPILDELAALLARTEVAALFAAAGPTSSDPLTAFYELFLRAYDPVRARRHGVYFTPESLVCYIVRSVDALLTDEFGLQGGLAGAPVALGEDGVARGPRVFVLDPACGTGAFLAGIVAHIAARLRESQTDAATADEVRQQLISCLASLAGCELLPALYLIAHLLLGLRLARLDALSPHDAHARGGIPAGMPMDLVLGDALEDLRSWPRSDRWTTSGGERGVNRPYSDSENDTPMLVILGNPPYAGHSASGGAEIATLLRGVEPLTGRQTSTYFAADGVPLAERNLKWLNDDYVKFIRAAQWRIERAGQGILAFVTSSGYLDNPTFRAMRSSLMRSFDAIYLLNLHGNGKRGDRRGREGGRTRDENVFAIQQGVAIGLFVRRPGPSGPSRAAAVRYAELRGARTEKLAWLAAHDLHRTRWSQLAPVPPRYAFTPRDGRLEAEYACGCSLPDMMPERSLGILSKRDALAIGFSTAEALAQVITFVDQACSDAECSARFGLPLHDKDGWDLAAARSALEGDIRPDLARPLLYRPFDTRFVYYDPTIIARPNVRIMRHLARPNIALVVGRQGAATGAAHWDVVFATTQLADHNLFRRGGATVFPLYLYSTDAARPGARTPNIEPRFVADVCAQLGMRWLDDGTGDRFGAIGPEDVFAYIYAVLWTPSFRARYADFLATDFPRLPLTSDIELFARLCALGERLLGLHLGQSAPSREPVCVDHGGMRVERVRYARPEGAGEQRGRVWVNSAQYIEGVAPQVWEFSVGGYRVAEKWLKDRTGRTLTADEIERYQSLLAAVAETLVTMRQLDAAIELHGGWPLTRRASLPEGD